VAKAPPAHYQVLGPQINHNKNWEDHFELYQSNAQAYKKQLTHPQQEREGDNS